MKKIASTQDHLPIAGIQENVVIMNDASLRVVLRVDPINFDLKSEQEQDSIIFGYQNFINSLDFPIQIVIQSRKLDLERYLVSLEGARKNLDSDLLRIQVEDYVGYIRRLISVANIMSKKFYIIVSYSVITPTAGLASLTGGNSKHPTGPVLNQEEFQRYSAEAVNRANIVASNLGRLGNRVSMLNTQQLIELFYGIYNPDIATEERLTNIDTLEAGVVINQNAISQPSEESAETANQENQPTS